VIFHPGHNPRDAVLVFRQQRYHSSTARLYGSDIHRAGVTLGIGSSRCAQGAPDGPSSLLLYKDKESASSSRCAALQRAVPALQARMDAVLAGSGIARCGGRGLHHHSCTPQVKGLIVEEQSSASSWSRQL